jgi:hypothetical protein
MDRNKSIPFQVPPFNERRFTRGKAVGSSFDNLFTSSISHNQLEPSVNAASSNEEKNIDIPYSLSVSYPPASLPSIHSITLPSIQSLPFSYEQDNVIHSDTNDQSIRMLEENRKRCSSSRGTSTMPFNQQQVTWMREQSMYSQESNLQFHLQDSSTSVGDVGGIEYDQRYNLISSNDQDKREQQSEQKDNTFSTKRGNNNHIQHNRGLEFDCFHVLNTVSTEGKAQTIGTHFKMEPYVKDIRSIQKGSKKYLDIISYNDRFYQDLYAKKRREKRSTNNLYRNIIVFDEKEEDQEERRDIRSEKK